MWRHVAPGLADSHRVVLFDHVGSADSDLRSYSRSKYDSLHGYADDVLEIMATSTCTTRCTSATPSAA
jgi:sigma-B regulation protein RsbQ